MYIFVSLFVSAMYMKVNALYKINCVTDCKSIGYTIYNILCNAFTLVGRCLYFVACRVAFGRQAQSVPGVRYSGNAFLSLSAVCNYDGTLPSPGIYPPYLLVYARWSLWGHRMWRNVCASNR